MAWMAVGICCEAMFTNRLAALNMPKTLSLSHVSNS